ncbi:WD40 repeat-containing protein HOS15-like isoform X2 [Daphnia pulicaria]|uniref:WD40 repeat-containing protein HOS15-like isoform X1 n=1 Tax=Daphnia pulicaria TaxID=35523 RepID=UPI001EEB38A5|nr:WD40 repeat-containing protein HOS15-like isoform X1 [Daphnia pulicaria]XP_046656183.1 WD40 repeat-containing protein HOS15-like isoform X2 [Daphnia pulicaria]
MQHNISDMDAEEMASSREESEDLTCCSVCFLRFDMVERKPKFLPCSHTFCLSCLKLMAIDHDGKMIDCPVCLKPFSIASVEILPNNMYALQIIKMSKIMTNVQKLMFTPRWCLTCKGVAKESCFNSHSTISLAQDGEELQRKIQDSEKNLNDALEKRAKIQIHHNAVLNSLKEAKYSAKKEAEENTQHTFTLMTALESIDKLKNGKQDVPEAREKIEAIFREAENELQSASQLMFQYEDQTEIRVWIEKAPSSGKTCFLSPKLPACNSDLVKTTETRRICPSEEKEKIMCCALNPVRPILVCGLESGKLCLFEEEHDCDFEPFSDWKGTIVETLSTKPVSFIAWDLEGTRFAVGFVEGLVQVWSRDCEKTFELQNHTMTVSSISWNHNKEAVDLFLTTSIDMSVAVLSATLQTVVQQFPFQSEVCDTVWVSADSFVCFNEDNIFDMHQIGKDKPIRTFRDLNGTLIRLCFRGRLASSSDDGCIKIWSLEEDKPVRQYSTDSPVYSIDWIPINEKDADTGDNAGCQQLLASGLENGLVHIWDVSGISDSPLETLKGHTEPVNIVYFSWCGKLLATLSDRNNTLIVWSTKSWEKVYETIINDGSESDSREPYFLSWNINKVLATVNGGREVTVAEFE